MTVGLAILVCDEAATVERAIRQTLPVADHVTVIDTGSTDETRDIVRALLDEIPGRLYEREWRGFGPNRTEALDLARPHSDYTLMLDADHTLHIDGDQPDLCADEYLLRVRDDGGRLPLLTRNQHPFRYDGVAHAYLTTDTPARIEQTDWLSIDGGPGATRGKLERDRQLLEQAFLANPDDARTVFYLAQTYRDLDLPQLAIRFYLMRAAMGGFQEEAYFARYQAGVLLSEHVSFDQGADELLRAWRARPSRMEALRALANAANSVADKAAAPDDALFVNAGAYGG